MISLLYVDDEPVLLELAKSLLEETGTFSVDTKASAKEGLAALATRHYDAIVADYLMPEMDGISFLRHVRENYGDIPFILLTGRGCEEVVINALNNGVDFYLQKGGDPRIVFAELKHILNQCGAIRKTKDDLHKREERYHDLQNANDLIQSVAPDGRFHYVNKKWLDTLGYDETDLEKLRIFDIIHPESLAYYRALFQRVISGENVGIIDAVLKTRDGKKVYIEGISSCHMADGKPQYTRGIFKDVTDRKIAEEALRKSEEKFHTVFDWANDAILLHTLSTDSAPGRFIETNLVACRMLGYTREELLSLGPPDIVPPELHAQLGEIARQAQTQDKILFETRLLRKDGSTFPAESSGHLVNYEGKRTWISHIRDITERKQAEGALRESEEKFRSLVEYALDGIMILDLEGTILFVNHAAARMIESDNVAGLPGRNVFEFIAPESRDVVVKDFKQVAWGHDAYLAEYNAISVKGKKISVESIGKVISFGGRPAILNSVRDITERKRAEEALRQANRKLTTLSSITRHDIRNNLLTLRGYNQLAENLVTDEKVRDLLRKQDKAAEAISQQIEFTKDYESIGVKAPAWQNVYEVITHAIANLDLKAVSFGNETNGLEVYADTMLGKVFYNLIDNAVRYGDTISEIHVSQVKADTGLVLVFEDNGVGIPVKEKEMIFLKGFGKNTGLGLFLSREILSITGISICETGKPPGGARFEIAVPEGAYRFIHS
jgi:PAS domain S-box-containing protein